MKHSDGGFYDAMFDTTGRRVLSSSGQSDVSVWDAATGVEIASFAYEGGFGDPWEPGAMIDSTGKRVLSWNKASQWVRVHDVGWSVPRRSNRELIAEVCARTLRGPETLRSTPFVNGSGNVITHDSVRRISQAADFAPLLRARVGEDVCAPASWW